MLWESRWDLRPFDVHALQVSRFFVKSQGSYSKTGAANLYQKHFFFPLQGEVEKRQKVSWVPQRQRTYTRTVAHLQEEKTAKVFDGRSSTGWTLFGQAPGYKLTYEAEKNGSNSHSSRYRCCFLSTRTAWVRAWDDDRILAHWRSILLLWAISVAQALPMIQMGSLEIVF